MSIKIIACIDNNWAIGKDNDLLFNIKDDGRLLKELTYRSVIVAGKNTYKQFPLIDKKRGIHGLAGRTNLILTHDTKLISNKNTYYLSPVLSRLFLEKIDPEDEFSKYSFNVFGGSFKEIYKIISELDSDVFILGGETVYKEFCRYCDTAYITKVNTVREDANKFMVNLDKSPEWDLTRKTELIMDKYNNLQYQFCVYKRSAS